MLRQSFDRELHRLQDEMLVLGSMVEKAIIRSVETLRNRDVEAARQIVADDLKINRKRFDIEEECIQLVATQLVDLERMADHAEGIAKIAIMMGGEPPLKPLIDIPRMAEKAVDMLRRSLEAFIERDVEEAKRICEEDDEVDALYDQVYRELLTYMLQDPRNITRATWLLWVAHNLERIADRATNICERAVFLSTGKMEDLNVSKY